MLYTGIIQQEPKKSLLQRKVVTIAGYYAYFQYFTNKYAFYRVNLLGPLQVEEFKPDIMNIK